MVILVVVSLGEAATNLGKAFYEVMNFHVDTNGTWPEHPWLEKLLLVSTPLPWLNAVSRGFQVLTDAESTLSR